MSPVQQMLDLDQGPATAPAGAESPRSLFYVTNAANLRSILAAGLIRPMAGWPKYCSDYQRLAPGYIPFFFNGVPHDHLVDQVTQHDEHDLPIVMEFDPEPWVAGPIRVLKNGVFQSGSLPDIPATASLVLVQGVIPLAPARSLHFRNDDDAVRFSSDCAVMSNTRADILPRGCDIQDLPILEGFSLPETLPSRDLSAEETMRRMQRVDAGGGILAALTRLPRGGSEPAIREIFAEWPIPEHQAGVPPEPLPDPLTHAITAWVRSTPFTGKDTMALTLYAALDFLASAINTEGFSAGDLLDAIRRDTEHAPPKEFPLLQERLNTVRAVVDNHDDPTPFFRGCRSPVLRGLLLFLLDREYRGQRSHPYGISPGEADLLLAEIMRGAHNGWSGLPIPLRGGAQAELATGYAMARLYNKEKESTWFRPRSFTWADDRAMLADMLRVITKIMVHRAEPEDLRRHVKGQQAEHLQIRVTTRAPKGSEGIRVTSTRKGKGKKSSLTIELVLPWD